MATAQRRKGERDDEPRQLRPRHWIIDIKLESVRLLFSDPDHSRSDCDLWPRDDRRTDLRSELSWKLCQVSLSGYGVAISKGLYLDAACNSVRPSLCDPDGIYSCLSPRTEKIFSQVGLSFALIAAAILAADYYIQFSAIPVSLIHRETDGLAS